MLDAFRSITSGNNKQAQKQTDELQLLITSAREERSALSTMLTTLTARSAKLTPLSRTLEQVMEQATTAASKLDELTTRISTLDDRAKELEQIEKRIEGLNDAAKQVELATQKAIGPDGELQKHREAVQHLSSQALQTQATLETLKKERVVLEELRGNLRTAEGEVKQATTLAGTVKGELDQIRAAATSLTQDYGRIRETSREAREDTTAAMTTVKDIEKKLVPLAQLHELSQSTEERLAALNALAEHVSHKAKALESQQQSVEHAVVEANRVNEMVWAMDVQIGKLNEGMKQAAKAEETIGRIEKLSADTAERVETAAKLNQEVQRETSKMQRDSSARCSRRCAAEVGTLSVRKKEFEAFDERVRVAQRLGVGGRDPDGRADRQGQEPHRADPESRRPDESLRIAVRAVRRPDQEAACARVAARAARPGRRARQEDRLADGLAQAEPPGSRRRCGKEMQDFYKSHAEIAKLRDKLGADRVALEAFGERMMALSTRAPELEAKLDAILGKMTLVEEGTQKATRLHETVAELDAQLSRVTARVPFVEKLESRLNGLNAVSADVDTKLEDQLARRAELETLKAACDGLAEQMVDAQHKLEDVRALQARLVPLVGEINVLRTQIVTAHERIGSLKCDESTIAEQAEAVCRAGGGEPGDRDRCRRAFSPDAVIV